MRIGIIGAGRIGGNAARLFTLAGHDVLLSYSRDPDGLAATAAALGDHATVGSVADAARFGDVMLLSVPWDKLDDVIGEADLDSQIVIDTTNQFGAGGLVELPPGMTAAEVNAARMPNARLVKAFNTLTAGFQAAAAGRTGPDRVAMFFCGDDREAKTIVSGLIDDAGFAPADLGGLADAAPMEAPRRPGAVYGEEYHEADALAFMAALRAGRPLPGPSVPR